MSKLATAVTWPTVIRDACWLWLRIEAGEKDEAPLRHGERLIYAIDSSVAFLYAQPTSNADHAQMLGLLDEMTLPDLAYVLGDQSLRRAEQHGGFILLPGHDDEFLRIFSFVQEDRKKLFGLRRSLSFSELYKNPVFSADINKFNALIEKRDSKDIAKFIAAEFEILHGMLTGRAFELTRWYDFLVRSSLKSFGDPEVKLPKPSPFNEEITKREELWFEALREEKSVRKSTIGIEDDAQALATLGWINDELSRLNDDRRVVLLTLDDSAQLAALKNSNLSGADAIRDPRQFVRDLPSTIGPFVTTEETTNAHSFGVKEWLGVLLSPFASGGKLDSSDVGRIAAIPSNNKLWKELTALFKHHHRDAQNNRLANAETEWRKFIRLGLNRHAVQRMQDDPRLRNIANVINSGTIDGLQTALTDYVIQTTSDASVSSIVAGLYISLGTKTERKRPSHTLYRMPVAIRSGDSKNRESYIKFMDTAVQRKDLDEVKLFPHFTEKYRAHLYYGVYFAAIGNWESTETLARAALAFADAQTTETEISGAEAAYLYAVALRHRVREPADLIRAEIALRQAEAFQRQKPIPHADPRLKIEYVAQNLMRQFSLLLLGEQWRPHNTRLMTDEQMLAQLHSARAIIDKEDDDLFRQIVLKQLLANIIVIGTLEFIRERGRSRTFIRRPEFLSAVKELSELLQKFKDGPGIAQAAQSRYLEILIEFGQWTIGTRKRSDARKLLDLISQAEADPPEMPYDRRKYRYLREYISG